MPRTKEQYDDIRKATREKIQAAAMQVFVKKGFGAANVQEIADTAGISVGLMYRHYRTKEHLFRELMEFAVAGMNKVAELFESGGSPRQLIGGFAKEIVQDMTAGDELANLLILMNRYAVATDSAADKETIFRLNERMLNAMTALIREGQELGDFRDGDPYAMTLLFFAALQGLAEMKLSMKNGFTMPTADLLTTFLLKEE
ncbi:transcriptional regulator, TetR family [Paenibacillaceae bacterium GAS479]|nr:transcriptional regulator, TetR family [Paenibacillaceae bacterium GAS479]